MSQYLIFFGCCTVFTISFSFSNSFGLSIPSSRNAHLVHQNWYHISFTFSTEHVLNTQHLLCLFVCLKPHEQFFSYLAAVTITGDMAANLGLWSALRAFEEGGIFIVPHLLRHGPGFIQSHPKDRHTRSTVGFEPLTQGSSDLLCLIIFAVILQT
jgi:hypothetical protein